MAIPIKEVPILYGEIAEEFVRKADAKAAKPRHVSSDRQRKIVREMERQLREFIPSWKK